MLEMLVFVYGFSLVVEIWNVFFNELMCMIVLLGGGYVVQYLMGWGIGCLYWNVVGYDWGVVGVCGGDFFFVQDICCFCWNVYWMWGGNIVYCE